VCYDESNRKVRLSLRQADILQALATSPKLLQQGGGVPDLQRGKAPFVLSLTTRSRQRDRLTFVREGECAPVFHPEFGRFMLEATPGKPWGIGFKDLLDVEPNMKLRCDHSGSTLQWDEFADSITPGGR
jgi:glutamate--cysteine ligase catalytic subunit